LVILLSQSSSIDFDFHNKTHYIGFVFNIIRSVIDFVFHIFEFENAAN